MSSNDAFTHDDGTRAVRAGTVVWGLIALAVGALVLLSRLADIDFDTGLVLMGLLIGTGLALVIGGLVSMTGRKQPGTTNHQQQGKG